MVEMLNVEVTCPKCGILVHIPFMKGLEAKAIEDYDMVEISAQDKLSSLQSWLKTVSLLGLIKYWIRR